MGRGLPTRAVAPAALCSTFVTSVVGSLTYAGIALTTEGGDIAPEWALGLCCGLGGVVGGYIGALLQPRAPERLLRLMLGALAVALAALYAVQAVA